MNSAASFSTTNIFVKDLSKVSVEFAELPQTQANVLRINLDSLISGLTLFFDTRDDARNFAHAVWGAWTAFEAEQLEILEGAGV